MKKILIIPFLFLFLISYSQENKELDVVITIDNTVPNSLENIKMIIEYDDGDSVAFSPKYHPGNLSITKKFYDEIISDRTTSVFLVFSYKTYHKNKSKGYYYKIKYGKKWLEENFAVLKIYNLRKRKDRRKYIPLNKGLDYSVSIDFGYYSILNLNQSE